MSGQASTTANALVAEALRGLTDTAEAIRSHRFLERLRAGEVPAERLRALAGEQHAIISSDRRSFAQLATRFPAGLAGGFFLSMAEGEGIALEHLHEFAGWLGQTEADLRDYEPQPGAQTYPAFVAWLALNGSQSDVALAFLANLEAWGDNCRQVATSLRAAYGADDGAVAFFEFFASPPPDFESRAMGVLAEGLAAGDSPARARRATRLLQAYELSFWDTLAEGL
ncbi:MAG: transcriptional regulator [Haloechinothrix sp.]